MFDDTSALRRHPSQNSLFGVEAYLSKNPGLRDAFIETSRELKRLVYQYRVYLDSVGFLNQANALFWGVTSVERVRSKFLSLLMSSYRVFDETHTNYARLLRRVERYNPEWVEAVKRDHEQKLQMARVPIYPIDQREAF